MNNNDSSENQSKRPIHVKIAGRRFKVPGSRLTRVVVGFLMLVGGVFGFLPVLGFWMVPLGLIILSVDFAIVRRFRRRVELVIARWRKGRPSQ